MPELSEQDLADLRALVAKQTEIADYIRLNLGMDGAGGDSSVLDLKAAGVDFTGVAGGQKAIIEAAVATALGSFANSVGPTLVGCGIIKVEDTINYRHTGVDMPAARHQAGATFAGPMMKIGRYGATTNNASRATPTHMRLVAWGGDRTSGQRPAIVGFELNDEISPGNDHFLTAAYCGIGAHVTGNWEKQRTRISGNDCGTVLQVTNRQRDVLVNGVPNGTKEAVSADSNVFLISATNCNRLCAILDTYDATTSPVGPDMSGIYDYVCEAAQPTFPATPLIEDQNDKMSTHRGIIRGMKGQGGSDGVLVDMARNDGADTVQFDLRFTTAGGTAFDVRRARHALGQTIVRAGTDAGVWNNTTKTVDDTRNVPTPTQLFGQTISNNVRSVVVSSVATYGLQHGTDTYWSKRVSFAPAHTSMGAFSPNGNVPAEVASPQTYCNRPKNNWYPTARVAIRYHKGEQNYWPNSEVHGKIQWDKDIQESTTEAPAPWVQTGYDGIVEAGGSFTHIIRGAVSFGDAVAAPWRAKFTGEQIARFESITDLDGMAVTYKRGLWTLEGQHRVSTIALQAQASRINTYFRRAGLGVAPQTGDRAGEWFTAQPDGSWRSERAGSLPIIPGRMAQTDQALARMAVQPDAAQANIYDGLLYELADMGLLAGGVTGHLWGAHDAGASLNALFPAPSGTWYDATVYGTQGWTARRGFAVKPPTVTVVSAPAEGSTLTVTGPGGQTLTITFSATATNINAGQPTAVVDNRKQVGQIAADITTIIQNRNQNTAGYLPVSAPNLTNNTVRLGASLVALDHTAGGALTIGAWQRLGIGYNMKAVSEGLAAGDMLMLAVALAEVPGAASQNASDIDTGNGLAKLRLRDASFQSSAGTTTGLTLPAGQSLMPLPRMFGSLGAIQFGVDQGRIAAQAAQGGFVGAPDQIAFAGSRELFLSLILRASDLVENVGGVLRAKDDRLLRLHRAAVAAYQGTRALA